MNNRIFKSVLLAALISSAGAVYGQKYENGLVDKTIAIVGNDAIMLSSLEYEVKAAAQYGVQSDRCGIFEEMLRRKLMYNRAKMDSVTVSQEQIDIALDQYMGNLMATFGGEKATEKYFGKPIYKLRDEYRSQIEERQMTQEVEMQAARKVGTLTPSDVRRFYNRTPKDSLPVVSTQYQIRQIVLYPDRTDAVLEIKAKLLEFRSRIMNGEKFSTLASLYSEDMTTAIRGGELRMAPKDRFWPAFSDAAMSLNPGQVSQIVETPDGFHLIQMIEKDGDMFNARHILLRPNFTSQDRIKAFARLDSIRRVIASDSITFEMAAQIYSQDPKSKVNGGLVADEYSGSAFFEKDRLDPQDYRVLSGMKPGDISKPFESRDHEGNAGNTIYKILKLEKIIPSHVADIESDYNKLLDLATQKAAEDQVEKFINENIRTTYIRIDPLFKNCKFKRDWLSEKISRD